MYYVVCKYQKRAAEDEEKKGGIYETAQRNALDGGQVRAAFFFLFFFFLFLNKSIPLFRSRTVCKRGVVLEDGREAVWPAVSR
jgi:hypothetical protein